MVDRLPWLFILLPLMFVAFVCFSLWRGRKYLRLLIEQGLGYIKLMRNLLAHIQQHRGLTTGYLNGNHDMRHDIEKLQKVIYQEIINLNEASSWVQNNAKWVSILDHWSRLSSSYANGQSANNLKQHNRLIANLLYFIEDIADAHNLHPVMSRSLSGVGIYDWRSLLFIAESIGQARALGTGVVAKGECSSVLRIQLNHLRNKISTSLGEHLSEQACAEIQQLLVCIEKEVIVDHPTITPNEYFQLATRSLERVLEQFDRHIENLNFQRK